MKNAWNSFFFAKMPQDEFALFRFSFYLCQILALQMIGHQNLATLNDIFYNRNILFGVIDVVHYSENFFLMITIALNISLVLSLFGWGGSISRFSAALLATYYYGMKYNYRFLHHSESPLVISLFVMALASVISHTGSHPLSQKRNPSDTSESWALPLLQIIVVFVFFSAGILKIRLHGTEWFYENTVGRSLLQNHVVYIKKISTFPEQLQIVLLKIRGLIVEKDFVGKSLSALTVVFEISAPLVFFSRTRISYVVAMIGFTLLAFLIAHHMFFFSLLPLILSFLNWNLLLGYWQKTSSFVVALNNRFQRWRYH